MFFRPNLNYSENGKKMKLIWALLALIMAACLNVSVAGYEIQLSKNNTSEKMGYRTFEVDIPEPVNADGLLARDANGIVVVNNETGDARDLAISEIESYMKRAGETLYYYNQKSIRFWGDGKNKTMAGSIDIFFFAKGAPTLEENAKIIEKALPRAAEKLAAEKGIDVESRIGNGKRTTF